MAAMAAWPSPPSRRLSAPRLGQEQRAVPGEVLQAGEVAPQVGLRVEVDVERADVEERQRQVLGRWVVHVGQQRLRRRRLHVVVELAQEAFDAGLAVPADDGGGNLVAEGEDEGGGVVRQLAHAGDDVAADAAAEIRVVEEREVLRPGQPHHHAQAVPRRRVEEAGIGRRVGADGVQPRFPHAREVVRDGCRRRELAPRRVGCEGAVGDALDEEAVAPCREELAVDGGARVGGGVGHCGQHGCRPGSPRGAGARRNRSLPAPESHRAPREREAPAPWPASNLSSTRPRGSSGTRSRAAPGRCRTATGRSSTARAAA